MLVDCKGTNMVAALRTLRARHGDEAIGQLLERMPGEEGKQLRSGNVLVGGWYPVTVWVDLLDHVRQHFNYGDSDFQALGFATVQSDLAGMYRFLVKLVSPEMLLSWGPKTFGQYYRGGNLTVRHIAPGLTHAHYQKWQGFSPPIWQTVAGGCCAALRTCGATFAEGRIDMAPGGADMLLTLHWAR